MEVARGASRQYLNDCDVILVQINHEKTLYPSLWGRQQAELMVCIKLMWILPHCDNLMWILPHCDKPMEWKHRHNFLEPDLGDLLTDEGCHHQTMITTSVGGIMEVMVVFIPVGSFQKYIFLILSKKFAMLTWFNHDAKHIILGWDKGEYLVVWHCDNSAGALN